MSRRLALCLLSGVGAAALIIPSLATAKGSSIQITIDTPVSGTTVSNGQPVDITGWAVDASADDGTGIEAIEISFDWQNGTSVDPIFATYGIARPDVALAANRPGWQESGFAFTWIPQDLPEGPLTLRVWAHSTQHTSHAATVVLQSAPPPLAATPMVPAAALVPPTPTPSSYRVLPSDARIGCLIDLTLVAPAPYMQRPCPTQTVTPTAVAP
ncbi:MAG TPA: hypothetical protein VFC51_05340 [Chloroflexota bacterium]|nr:hypothetical protein [Chloroflexota bacterium]